MSLRAALISLEQSTPVLTKHTGNLCLPLLWKAAHSFLKRPEPPAWEGSRLCSREALCRWLFSLPGVAYRAGELEAPALCAPTVRHFLDADANIPRLQQ